MNETEKQQKAKARAFVKLLLQTGVSIQHTKQWFGTPEYINLCQVTGEDNRTHYKLVSWLYYLDTRQPGRVADCFIGVCGVPAVIGAAAEAFEANEARLMETLKNYKELKALYNWLKPERRP